MVGSRVLFVFVLLPPLPPLALSFASTAEPAMSSKRSRSKSRSRSSSSERRRPAPHGPRSVGEWTSIENNSVLLLPPTAALLQPLLRRDAAASVAYVKVASFDLDDTVVLPATGKVFARDDPSDWKWLHPSVPQHLRYLHESGHLVVLFSNQMGIGKGGRFDARKADALREKVIRISAALDVPLVAFVATREDGYRKPGVAMWGLLQQQVQQCAAAGGCALDCNRYAFYVGDAAGRGGRTLAGRTKDFSCSDRKFAYNLSIPFLTPEECFGTPVAALFQEEPVVGAVLRPTKTFPAVPFQWGDVGPDELRAVPNAFEGLSVRIVAAAGERTATLAAEPYFVKTSGGPEMVLMVGYPGCGKSTFCRRHLLPHGYVYVNRDTLKTKERCLAAAAEAWRAGRHVVVDNLNASRADRAPYIALATARLPPGGVPPVRILSMQHTKGLAMHLNQMRGRLGLGPRVSSMVYNVFQSKYSVPRTPAEVAEEGVGEVWEVPPVVSFDGLPPHVQKEFYKLS
ncbi:bifunctional polynucleotide phosphatase/kinase [Strigomonas culicis]|uniref:Bifunctional polynucleotide phosphatase/kinase n=1 Tax=Strigomonas culicis TaxID=28005 RepID=S9W935_9TRYP|nr:bifunctional polynucleotide phosphatase/kinase [Strigomonas culicis]EPY32390.1 bifunctional polynucleotide phosphatase/kinase [Strigomonas culicis]|eukprot:EPY19904.1 bifunctional polynucleotide phosphatase/kinase [Strigomonas culicis]